eukprot:3464588-Pyramimonas_sp.AAC.1
MRDWTSATSSASIAPRALGSSDASPWSAEASERGCPVARRHIQAFLEHVEGLLELGHAAPRVPG